MRVERTQMPSSNCRSDRAASITDMRQALETIVDQYHPQLPARGWNTISEFVRELVRGCDPETESQTSRLLTFVTNYARWASRQGYPITKEFLAQERLLTFYLQDTTSSPGDMSRRKMAASQLLANVLGVRVPVSTSKEALTPYPLEDVRAMRIWAAGQSSARQIRNANTLLALTAGAGLTLAEMMVVQNDDVSLSDDLLTVHVRGRNARAVPVLRSWMTRLQSVVASTSTGECLFETRSVSAPPRDTLREFLDHTHMTTVRPEPSRLRATWAHTLLQARVPIPTFMAMAGMNSTTSLGKYLAFMPTVDAAAVRDAGAGL